MCELFSVENNKSKLINLKKIKILTKGIFDYLKKEDDYELLPENINIFFLYTGKILNKCKKYASNAKIINSRIIDLKKIINSRIIDLKKIIENFINELTKNKKNSTLIIKKYFKDLYEVNK
jgi:hypothetical protein